MQLVNSRVKGDFNLKMLYGMKKPSDREGAIRLGRGRLGRGRQTGKGPSDWEGAIRQRGHQTGKGPLDREQTIRQVEQHM